jgi:hypothetical protein
MSPKEINIALRNIFNGNGLEAKGFMIKADSPVKTTITHQDNTTIITFIDNLPRAEITRFITLKAYIEEITFGEDGGSIKLRNFPDINFGYDSNSLLDFLNKNIPYDFGSMDSQISEKYCDDNKKEIAKKCLQYTREWSTMSMSAGVDFSNADKCQRKSLKRDCYNFVYENVEQDVKEKYGSVFLTFILLTVILPAIISWIVHRVLDELFN